MKNMIFVVSEVGYTWEKVINQNYAIKDGNIITGVGPKAGKNIVKKAVEV